jgi:hypothetical protein
VRERERNKRGTREALLPGSNRTDVPSYNTHTGPEIFTMCAAGHLNVPPLTTHTQQQHPKSQDISNIQYPYNIILNNPAERKKLNPNELASKIKTFGWCIYLARERKK